MSTSKYFTPDIEDIRVGYEGWYFNSCMDELGVPELNYARWEKTILNKGQVETILKYGVREFKSAYLTKEQIEAEGFEYKQTNKIRYWYEKESPEVGGNWYGYYIYKAKLIHDPEMKYLKILFSFDAVEDECVFEGECKDINALRHIMKLLHIK